MFPKPPELSTTWEEKIKRLDVEKKRDSEMENREIRQNKTKQTGAVVAEIKEQAGQVKIWFEHTKNCFKVLNFKLPYKQDFGIYRPNYITE